MRILIVGAGATGGYFGARLAHAGRDVTFLVRPARAEQLRVSGLQIFSPNGDLQLQPALVTSAQLRREYDVIVLAVKAYALDAALDDLAPAVSEETMVVPFLNGMRHIDALVARFGERPILGGVCLVSAHVEDAGTIVQLSGMQELVYGERDGTASARVAALDATLQGAGFAAQSTPHILPLMWGKWVALATLAGITCLLRGNVGEIEAIPGGAALALTLLDECTAVATAATGAAPPPDILDRMRTQLTTPGSSLAASMYRDLQEGRHVEVDQIVGDLLDRARTFKLTTPLLSAAYVNLRLYDDRVGHANARFTR